MSRHEQRRRRAENVKARARSGQAEYARCRVHGCGQPTRAAAGKGVSRLYCRAHEDHFQRHGSYLKGSYSATALAPHRKAARAWLKANAGLPYVTHALRAVGALMASAGSATPAFRLRGLTPAERAKVAWARLRQAEAPPEKVLAAWLAVELAVAADPQADRKSEFKQVQAAKLVHRMASGTHKRWERERPDGRVEVTELHRYPMSRGRVLRHIGEQLERAAELVVQHHLSEIAATTGA